MRDGIFDNRNRGTNFHRGIDYARDFDKISRGEAVLAGINVIRKRNVKSFSHRPFNQRSVARDIKAFSNDRSRF